MDWATHTRLEGAQPDDLHGVDVRR
jgi:hypothetical protein